MYEQFVRSQVILVKQPRIILAAMETETWLKTNRGTTGDREAVIKFTEALEAVNTPRTEHVVVRFTDTNRVVARAGVTAVLEAYDEIYGEVKTNAITRDLNLIQEQKKSVLSNLRTVEGKIERLTSSHGGADNLRSEYTSRKNDLEYLERSKRDLTLDIDTHDLVASEHDTDTEDGGSRIDDLYDLARNDPELDKLLNDRSNLQRTLQQLLVDRGKNHPRVKAAFGSLQVVQQQIDARASGQRGAPYDGAPDDGDGSLNPADPPDLAMARMRVKELETLIKQVREDVTSLGKKQDQLASHEAEETRYKDQRTNFLNREQSLKLQTFVPGQIEIAATGSEPLEPSVDPRTKYMPFFGFVGAVFGVGLMLLRGLLDHRLHDSADAQLSMAQARMLGVLPHLPDDLSEPEQAGIAAHCVHHIRALMQLAPDGRRPQVYAVTSPASEDGKTSLALATGLSFAAADYKTLLIDCDLSGGGLTDRTNAILRRKIGQILLRDGLVSAAQLDEALDRAENTPGARLGETLINMGHISEADLNSALSLQEHASVGLLDCMAGESLDDCVFATGITGLSVLPVGSARASHIAKLSPAGVQRILNEARETYEVIIVDTGPVQGSLEASIVSPLADGVVFVVSRGNDRPAAERALSHLDQIGAKILGIVFNRAAESDVRAISFSNASSQPPVDEDIDRPITERTKREHQSASRFGPIARAVASYSQGSESDQDEAEAKES